MPEVKPKLLSMTERETWSGLLSGSRDSKPGGFFRLTAVGLSVFLWLGCLRAAGSMASGEDSRPDAVRIMESYREQRSSRDEKVKLTMQLIDSRDRQRTRKLEQSSLTDKHGDQKLLILATEPADIRGTAFLIVEHHDSDNDQWLYLPAFRRVRRVLPNEKSDSFLGSDFAYEDLETERTDGYDYRLAGVDTLEGGVRCWVIEALPGTDKMKKESGYGKRELWISCDNSVGLKTLFYDKSGKAIKLFRANEIRPEGDGLKLRAHHLEMINLVSGHKTIITYEDFRINRGVPERIFTRAHLERGLF